jgi:group I intron endonuclease
MIYFNKKKSGIFFNFVVCSIYIIRNFCNEKVYIGQTWQTIKARFSQHKRCKKKTYVNNAFKKYGKENFYIFLIGTCYDQDSADFLETALIEVHNSLNPKFGYNLQEGGKNGKRNIQARRNMSIAHGREINENWFLINKLEPQIIENIKNDINKQSLSEEIIKIIKTSEIKYCQTCRNNKLLTEFDNKNKCIDCMLAIKKYEKSLKNKKRRKKSYFLSLTKS